jgi:hypothetical protein
LACGSDIRGARSLLVLHQRRDRGVVLEANGREFGTAPTCLAFMQLEKSEGAMGWRQFPSPLHRRPRSVPTNGGNPASRLEPIHAGPVDDKVQPILNHSQLTFCLVYIANGFNATAAYKTAYPAASFRSARELGYRLLTKVDIKAFVAEQLAQRWKPLQMTADEALARIATAARADIRTLFDEAGRLLLPHLWPDDIATSIQALHLDRKGKCGVRLVDKLAALRLILECTNRFRSDGGDSVNAIGNAIRADLETRTV